MLHSFHVMIRYEKSDFSPFPFNAGVGEQMIQKTRLELVVCPVLLLKKIQL